MSGESHQIDAAVSELVANPPIKAPFIYANEEDDLRNATKHGIIQMQAALLLENHPDVSFDSLANVVIANDVLGAVHALELRVGQTLEAGRNGAANMPVFNVEVGGRHFLFIGTEASKGLVGTGSIDMLSACEMVRVRLAEVHAQALLRKRIGSDPRLNTMDDVRSAWFGRARDAWLCYAGGRLAHVDRVSTREVFLHLERDIEVERRLMVTSIEQFALTPNVGRVADDIQKWAAFLTNSMAAAIGQLHASRKDIDVEHGAIKIQIEREGFTGYWHSLSQALSVLWETQTSWTRANDLVEISRLFVSFVSLWGLSFGEDGEGSFTANFVAPSLRTLH